LLFSLLLRFLAVTFAIIRAVWQQAIGASPVIASAAKQSMPPQTKEWIASLRSQ
jgi:hypothetical protein